MVNLIGKKDNGLSAVKKSLEDNLNIVSASSRLADVNNAIIDSKYRIKDLSETSFNTITQGYFSYVIDNRLFVIASGASNWVVEVFDIFTMSLITTINTTTAGGFMSVDDNYTVYTHNYKDTKIYKKQFIDQTEG